MPVEHRRPLVAFLVVLAFACAVVGNGVRGEVIRVLDRAQVPSAVMGAVAPDLVLGQALHGEQAAPVRVLAVAAAVTSTPARDTGTDPSVRGPVESAAVPRVAVTRPADPSAARRVVAMAAHRKAHRGPKAPRAGVRTTPVDRPAKKLPVMAGAADRTKAPTALGARREHGRKTHLAASRPTRRSAAPAHARSAHATSARTRAAQAPPARVRSAPARSAPARSAAARPGPQRAAAARRPAHVGRTAHAGRRAHGRPAHAGRSQARPNPGHAQARPAHGRGRGH